jgi:hypothetical protein
VPKLIAIHDPQHTMQQAQEYVKMHILLPSGFLGLICLLGAVGGLGYQLFATDSYTWDTFYQSSGLFLSGVGFGAAQTLYQRYLLREFPEVLASRMKRSLNRQRGSVKKGSEPREIEHSGRQLIPLAYAVGTVLLVGSAIAAFSYGRVNMVPALLMPWAGFYWAKLFLWRRVIKMEK